MLTCEYKSRAYVHLRHTLFFFGKSSAWSASSTPWFGRIPSAHAIWRMWPWLCPCAVSGTCQPSSSSGRLVHCGSSRVSRPQGIFNFTMDSLLDPLFRFGCVAHGMAQEWGIEADGWLGTCCLDCRHEGAGQNVQELIGNVWENSQMQDRERERERNKHKRKKHAINLNMKRNWKLDRTNTASQRLQVF